MLRKLSLLFVALFLLLPIAPAFAQNALDIPPEFNEICWKKKDCTAIRLKIAGSDSGGVKPDEGFVPEAPCSGGTGDEAWGKCLPANIAVTEIAFGGQRRFLGIGDFLTSTYKLALSVASILAVIMIIMSGFQWSTSGGNSEVISAAKHHMSGALIGLFIAYSSYLILSTINPDLVNLRLPQTWLLRPQSEAAKLCSITENKDLKYAYLLDASNQEATVNVSTVKPEDYKLSYADITDPNKQNCGNRYAAGGGAFVCTGDVCPSGQSCVNVDVNGSASDRKTVTNFSCKSASVVGVISGKIAIQMCDKTTGLASYYHSWAYDNLYLFCAAENGNVFTLNEASKPAIKVGLSDFGTLFEVPMQDVKSESSTQCPANLGYGMVITVPSDCSSGGLSVYKQHLVGKNGQDLGILTLKTDHWEPADPSKMNRGSVEGMIFTPSEIKKGSQRIDIDISNFSK